MGDMRNLFDQMDNESVVIVDFEHCNILYMNENARYNRKFHSKAFFKMQNSDFMHRSIGNKNDVELRFEEAGESAFTCTMVRSDFEGRNSLIITMDFNVDKGEDEDTDLITGKYEQILDTLCQEYFSVIIVDGEKGKFNIVHADDSIKDYINKYKIYEDLKKDFVNKFVIKNNRNYVNGALDTKAILDKLNEEGNHKIIYQTVSNEWRAFKIIKLGRGKLFILCEYVFDSEMRKTQKNKKVEEITVKYSENYDAIYRINIRTSGLEILLMNFENADFVYSAKNNLELESYYIENFVDPAYKEELNKKMSQSALRNYFRSSDEDVVSYYKEINGNWLKVRAAKDIDYSDATPYVIYAIKECNNEIEAQKYAIVSNTALSKMFIASVIFDREKDAYEVLYTGMNLDDNVKKGSFSQFVSSMHNFVYEDDTRAFYELFDYEMVEQSGFLEREFRAEDKAGMIHFYAAMSSFVMLPEGKKLLLLVMNNDEIAANRNRMSSLNKEYDMTRNVLYSLGDAYFGMYYFDFGTNRIQSIRLPVDMITIFGKYKKIDEFVNEYIDDMIHPDDRDAVRRCFSREFINEEIRNGRNAAFCEFQRLIDNEYKWVRLDIRTVIVKDKTVYEAVYAMKDINDEREAELKHNRKLMEAMVATKRANEAKNIFFSNMSHDMRTPLNAILGMTDVALKHMDNPQRVENSLTKIHSAGRILLYLINNVLDMAYIESGRTQINETQISLPDLFHGIVIMVQDRIKNKHMTFRAKQKNVTNEIVVSDKVLLSKIITNLIGNAIKYTNDFGEIDLFLEQKPLDEDEYAEYIIQISDTGVGMSAEFLEKIFVPFEREKTTTVSGIEGTGLGMSITKELIELLNGKIEVKSEVGVGSIFTITLRLKYADIEINREIHDFEEEYKVFKIENDRDDVISLIKEYQKEEDAKQIVVATSYDKIEFEDELEKLGIHDCILEPVFRSDILKYTGGYKEEQQEEVDFKEILAGKKILVVEDNEINIDIITDYLEDVKAESETAKNGREAYDKVMKDNSFDCILMDIQMPIMNGYDATELIRKEGGLYGRSVPIIAMTANAFAEDVIKSKDAGMNDHISKPINTEVFYSTIAKCLSQNSEI